MSEQAVQDRTTTSFELLLDILGPIVNKKGLDGHLQYTKSYCGLLKLAWIDFYSETWKICQ